MDRLQEAAAALVEDGVARGRSNHSMFHELAELALGELVEDSRSSARVPRLTEAWFC
jgi:hypothetical protein